MKARSVALAIGLALLAVGLHAAEPDLAVLPAMVRGAVLLPDGETPVRNMAVRLWNADTDEVIYRTRTDRYGVFEVPELGEGERYVTIGPVRIDMRILAARAGTIPQAHGVVLVMPAQAPLMPVLIPTLAGAAALPEIMSP